jgi:hypothetical protein
MSLRSKLEYALIAALALLAIGGGIYALYSTAPPLWHMI